MVTCPVLSILLRLQGFLIKLTENPSQHETSINTGKSQQSGLIIPIQANLIFHRGNKVLHKSCNQFLDDKY